MSIEEAIVNYVKVVQKLHEKVFAQCYPSLNVPSIEIAGGRKYIKVVRKDNQTCVHSFINSENGDILKPASWKAPAKHARGNVFDPDHGASALSAHGHVRYL
jgi:hypothetical protein